MAQAPLDLAPLADPRGPFELFISVTQQNAHRWAFTRSNLPTDEPADDSVLTHGANEIARTGQPGILISICACLGQRLSAISPTRQTLDYVAPEGNKTR